MDLRIGLCALVLSVAPATSSALNLLAEGPYTTTRTTSIEKYAAVRDNGDRIDVYPWSRDERRELTNLGGELYFRAPLPRDSPGRQEYAILQTEGCVNPAGNLSGASDHIYWPHTVKERDSLWTIVGRECGNHATWKELAKRMINPDLIHPGDKILIYCKPATARKT